MDFQIRPMNWEDAEIGGIPKDAQQVMDFFNKGLDVGSYSFIPRKIKITKEEILNLWMPHKENNITYVAIINDMVIGSGTVLVNSKGNQYSLESGRNDNNEYSITIDPDYFDRDIELKITKAILKKIKSKKIKVISHVYSTNKVLLNVMNNLGCKFIKKINPKRYVQEGLKEDVYLYELN